MECLNLIGGMLQISSNKVVVSTLFLYKKRKKTLISNISIFLFKKKNKYK